MVRSRWFMIAVVQLAALVVLGGGGALEVSEHEALPFDPLSDGEAERAIDVMLASDQVDLGDDDRFEVIGAALYTDKAFQEMESWPRVAETWVYDYDRDITVNALVDLDEDAVVEVEEAKIQPPLTAGETDRVAALALEDDRVIERLEDVGIEREGVGSMARLWTGPGTTACPEHRCALVAFLDEGHYVEDVLVLVDVSEEKVRGLLDVLEEHEEVGA